MFGSMFPALFGNAMMGARPRVPRGPLHAFGSPGMSGNDENPYPVADELANDPFAQPRQRQPMMPRRQMMQPRPQAQPPRQYDSQPPASTSLVIRQRMGQPSPFQLTPDQQFHSDMLNRLDALIPSRYQAMQTNRMDNRHAFDNAGAGTNADFFKGLEITPSDQTWQNDPTGLAGRSARLMAGRAPQQGYVPSGEPTRGTPDQVQMFRDAIMQNGQGTYVPPWRQPGATGNPTAGMVDAYMQAMQGLKPRGQSFEPPPDMGGEEVIPGMFGLMGDMGGMQAGQSSPQYQNEVRKLSISSPEVAAAENARRQRVNPMMQQQHDDNLSRIWAQREAFANSQFRRANPLLAGAMQGGPQNPMQAGLQSAALFGDPSTGIDAALQQARMQQQAQMQQQQLPWQIMGGAAQSGMDPLDFFQGGQQIGQAMGAPGFGGGGGQMRRSPQEALSQLELSGQLPQTADEARNWLQQNGLTLDDLDAELGGADGMLWDTNPRRAQTARHLLNLLNSAGGSLPIPTTSMPRPSFGGANSNAGFGGFW